MKEDLKKDLVRITLWTVGVCVLAVMLEPLLPNILKRLYVDMFEYGGILITMLAGPLSYAAYQSMKPVEPQKK